MTAPSAEAVSGMLAKRRVHWLPAYFPAGRIEGGMFLIGDPDGSPGKSLPIPLQPRSGRSLRDFGGDFRGDDLALLARAIGAGDDMAAAYKEAIAYLGLGEVRSARRASKPPKPEPEVRFTRLQAQEVWRSGSPLCDCKLGAQYLRSRGIDRWPETIFWHEACPFDRESAPAILAPVNDRDTGLVVGIWRIRLDAQGRKVERRGLGDCRENCSRLFPVDDDAVTLTEGVEDALAYWLLTGKPAWACLSSSFMPTVVLPKRIRSVTICQDNDAVDEHGKRSGPEAAQKLALRLRQEGRQVKIIQAIGCKDANDVLLRKPAS